MLVKIATGERSPLYAGGVFAEEANAEMELWGPQAFTVAADGSFWVADTVGHCLLQYSAGGRIGAGQAYATCLQRIKLPDHLVGAGDLKVTEHGIWVLDTAALRPALYFLSSSGEEMEQFVLPEGYEEMATALLTSREGGILIELGRGTGIIAILGSRPDKSLTPTPGFPHGKRLYTTWVGDWQSEERAMGRLLADGAPCGIEVSVPNLLGSLRILGGDGSGGIYLVIEEVASDTMGRIQVDQTVSHYDEEGTLLGIARVPVRGQHAYVPNGLAIGPDNAVYALLTRPEHLAIVALEFSDALEPVLAPPTDGQGRDGYMTLASTAAPAPETSAVAGCVYRSTVEARAWEYRENRIQLSTINTDGICTRRSRPHYFNTQYRDRSVAYDWGGGDSVAEYNGYMLQGYQAGDVDTDLPANCSRGVDCSGFVSRCWGLTVKHNTVTLMSVSQALSSFSLLKKGDIFNAPQRHTTLFDHRDLSTGFSWAWEATTTGDVDRVVWRTHDWAYYQNFMPCRFKLLCDP